jgi:hypothetical protein
MYFTHASSTKLWYKRLGHCNIKKMLNMEKKDMVRGLPVLSNHLPNCDACQFGKQNKLPFPKSCNSSTLMWQDLK